MGQMARLNHIFLGILILQIYAHAAPSDVSKIEEIAKVEVADQNVELVDPNLKEANPKLEEANSKVENADPKLDEKTKDVKSDKNSTDTQRQKRWYNPYGFPPINPLIYPSYNKRDEGQNTGYYGQDPLVQIHRQIQEIANIVRQPPPPPPPLHHIPIFFPVLFIPRGDCNCNPNPAPGPETTTESDKNGTTPSIMNRWPTRDKNWGFVVNETDGDSEEGVEFSRPISFDPIRLNRPMRPQPPVEHGSVQSDSNKRDDQPQSEAPMPETPASWPPTRPPPSTRPPPLNRPQSSSPFDYKPTPLAPPSRCDGAILTCCHQSQVVYECFAIQGCPDLSGYGSPCDPNLILTVIERFQTFLWTKK
ncbi:hypothetical protein HW555_004983 [Spodoptera exigua]|uniref:Uncharacterized protein n=1 Tax=Spodoptera exigua TaxID=7107 RepID=A0A835GJ85_SPOEX|nr:hypothetical protein HW555_004983 [Spodoptera exigua]